MAVNVASRSPVPIIDVSALLGSDAAARLSLARRIGQACEEIGFFVVVNHGISQTVIDEAWSQTEAFFDLAFVEKCCFTPEDAAKDPYGYSALGGEMLSAGKRAESGQEIECKTGDMKEMFNMGPKDPAAGMAPRRLPTKPEGFAEAWERYYDEVDALARRLLSALALSLDLPENWFGDKIDRHCSALRANNYPNQQGMEVPEGSIRASAHTDYGTITVLRSGGPGLQVCKDLGQETEDAWKDVPFVEDSYVINLGDLMRRWTNDRYCSTLHRVINPPAGQAEAWGRRMAMAYFHNLNKDALVEAIPSCVSDEAERLYDPIVAGEFLMLKHLASVGKADSDAHLKQRA